MLLLFEADSRSIDYTLHAGLGAGRSDLCLDGAAGGAGHHRRDLARPGAVPLPHPAGQGAARGHHEPRGHPDHGRRHRPPVGLRLRPGDRRWPASPACWSRWCSRRSTPSPAPNTPSSPSSSWCWAGSAIRWARCWPACSSAWPSRWRRCSCRRPWRRSWASLILVGTIFLRPSGILGVEVRDERRRSKPAASPSASAAWWRSTASTCRAAAGETLGIIGVNGAGKTTLMNCICGLYRPDGGDVFVAGDRVTGQPPHVVAHHGIGRTFQVPRVFSQDVADRQSPGAGARPQGLRCRADRARRGACWSACS